MRSSGTDLLDEGHQGDQAVGEAQPESEPPQLSDQREPALHQENDGGSRQGDGQKVNQRQRLEGLAGRIPHQQGSRGTEGDHEPDQGQDRRIGDDEEAKQR
jgi:hypothetical protein